MLLKPRYDDIILDVGCGEGYQLSYFACSVGSVVGVDIAKEKLEEAKERIKVGEFIQAVSEKLPFRLRVFDKVMCLELLEHLKDPSATLDEINEVLSKRGTLVISVPYRERIVMTQCIHCGKLTPLWGHIHSFDEKKISSILPSNYVLICFEYIGSLISSHPFFKFLPTRIWKTVDDILRHFPGERASWIISKAQKIK